ncbi:SH3 domain-containing protein [Streptomyces sp. NPDC101062]|uniref:SH3 domain-containing protein n=1 Tax=unclassified Streptomyces TaxID=2593676 RepID=UPI00380C8C2E
MTFANAKNMLVARQDESGRFFGLVLVVFEPRGKRMDKINVLGKRLGVALAGAVAVLVGVVGVTASGAAAAPAAAPAAATAEFGGVSKITSGSTKTVAVNGLRLRTKPSLNGWAKGMLYRGDKVFIRETFHPSYNPNWVGVVLKTRSAGGLPKLTRGYVHVSYLR